MVASGGGDRGCQDAEFVEGVGVAWAALGAAGRAARATLLGVASSWYELPFMTYDVPRP